jgi:hypothetical protein
LSLRRRKQFEKSVGAAERGLASLNGTAEFIFGEVEVAMTAEGRLWEVRTARQ